MGKEIARIVKGSDKHSNHEIDRIKERFDVFENVDLPFKVRSVIKRNLDLVGKANFNDYVSYAIMLGYFDPNPSSKYFYSIKDRVYYQIMDDEVINDSTGNQFWVVIRRGRITTFMLRKEIQTIDEDHNKEKMRVDFVIKDIKKFGK